MIAIDTNIVVCFKDDQMQFEKAGKLFSEVERFIPYSVILETEWVLRFAYGFTASSIAGALPKLLGLPNIHINSSREIIKAIGWHEQGLDFADALHLANSDALSELATLASALYLIVRPYFKPPITTH